MVFANATALPSLYYEMYPGTDLASLSWLEQQWVHWYVSIGNPVLATGLASFLLHEVSNWLRVRCWHSN
jgi:methylsterol monooxygenase